MLKWPSSTLSCVWCLCVCMYGVRRHVLQVFRRRAENAQEGCSVGLAGECFFDSLPTRKATACAYNVRPPLLYRVHTLSRGSYNNHNSSKQHN